jgi:hypothetical protein
MTDWVPPCCRAITEKIVLDKDRDDGGDLVRDAAKAERAGDRYAGFGRAEDSTDVSRGVTGDQHAAFEAKWAAGFVKVAGKHIKADGLVSRRGNRRIIPADLYEDVDEYLREDRIEMLATAAKVLHGRNATVFEKLYLNPLQGKRQATREELAQQFGVPVSQIYKIAERAKERVTKEVKRLQSSNAQNSKASDFEQEPTFLYWSPTPQCPHCGGSAYSGARGSYVGRCWGFDNNRPECAAWLVNQRRYLSLHPDAPYFPVLDEKMRPYKREIIREWMAKPQSERQTETQAARFAWKLVDRYCLMSMGERYKEIKRIIAQHQRTMGAPLSRP